MLDLRTDEELMVAAREGDGEAFRTLILRLRETVGRFLRHLGCSEAAAEDLAQETLMRLWMARERYEPTAALRTYVLTIAKNLWLKQVGRERRTPVQMQDADGLLLLADRARAWQTDGPEYRLLEQYRRYRLRQAIASLPETQRLVFVLAHIEDLPYCEIAEVLGIAEGTVKSRMHRAVRNLRQALSADYPGLADRLSTGKEE